jgi:hypothetical protein
MKQFLAQKCTTKVEHSSCSPDMTLNDFLLFPKIKSALKGQRFQDIVDRKNYDFLGGYSTAGAAKMFPAVVQLLG